MADVEVVIKIPEQMYNNAKKGNLCGSAKLVDAIANGIVLPEGHGDLFDKNELKVGPIFNEDGERVGYMYVTENELSQANVIVPGRKE